MSDTSSWVKFFDVTHMGVPRPQGSVTPIKSASTGRLFVKYSASTVKHRAEFVVSARAAVETKEPVEGPIGARLLFVFARPMSHYGTGRNSHLLKPGAPGTVTGFPDLDKLVRLCLDGVVIAGAISDDSLVTDIKAHKCYSDNGETSTRVELWRIIA